MGADALVGSLEHLQFTLHGESGVTMIVAKKDAKSSKFITNGCCMVQLFLASFLTLAATNTVASVLVQSYLLGSRSSYLHFIDH